MDILRIYYAQHEVEGSWEPWHIHNQRTGDILKVKTFRIQGEVRSEEEGPVPGIPRYVLICEGTIICEDGGAVIVTSAALP